MSMQRWPTKNRDKESSLFMEIIRYLRKEKEKPPEFAAMELYKLINTSHHMDVTLRQRCRHKKKAPNKPISGNSTK